MITTKKRLAKANIALAKSEKNVRFTNEQNVYRMSLVDYTICAVQWVALKSLEVTAKAVHVIARGFGRKPKASHY